MGRPFKNGIARRTQEEIRAYDRQRNKTPERIRWMRQKDLRRNFGMSVDDYQRMLDRQGGLCAICKMPESHVRNGKVKELSVDHDHITGKVRELLCAECNHALGKVRESEKILLSMLEYIRRHK